MGERLPRHLEISSLHLKTILIKERRKEKEKELSRKVRKRSIFKKGQKRGHRMDAFLKEIKKVSILGNSHYIM